MKLDSCSKCGKPTSKQIEILGKIRTVKVMCDCAAEALRKKAEEETNREKQVRIKSLMKNSLMDEKFAESTFENWDFEKGPKTMHELGKRFCQNFNEVKRKGLGLLIHGEPGNGKTYLSSSIANELLSKGTPVICVSVDGLLSRIKETYSKWGQQAEQDIIRGLQNADLLIIDDLGTEKSSDWSISTIYNIIDGRYRQRLPLIITTNLKINSDEINGELADRYGRRTEDRILEMCTPVLNKAKSIRVDEAKRKTKELKQILFKGDLNC